MKKITYPTPRCLLMSAGSLVGQNVQEILTRDHIDCNVIALNSIRSEPTLGGFNKVLLAPNTQDPEYESFFNTAVKQHSPDIIIPCRDEDVVFLAQWSDLNPEQSYRCLVGSLGLAKALKDKSLSYEISRQKGFPFVPSIKCESLNILHEFAEIHKFPLLVKPVSGFASQHVFIIMQAAQLEKWQNQPDYLLQPWLGHESELQSYLSQLTDKGVPLFHSFEEDKYSIQLFFNAQAQNTSQFFTRHHMQQGQSICVEKIQPCKSLKDIANQCKNAFEGQWRGPLNLQLQQKPGERYWIYEFNGRLTGASSARALMGFNELSLIWKHFLNRPLHPAQKLSPWPSRVFKRWYHLAEYTP